MPAPRVAVKILVEATWLDRSGAPQVVSAWMENKSAGGACVRVKAQIDTGARLNLQSRWERISGTVKYCRSVGHAYLVGIQRDSSTDFVIDHPVLSPVPSREAAKLAPAVAPTPAPVSAEPSKVEIAKRLAIEPAVAAPAPAQPIPKPTLERSSSGAFRSNSSQLSHEERKRMQHKWSDILHRHNGKDAMGEADNGNSDHGQETAFRPAGVAREASESFASKNASSSCLELLRIDDIYRTAGIVNPPSGYSIGKVIEMLESDHMRDLSRDVKRAALLMALDAAQVPVEEVIRDAKARQSALDSYESAQRKEVEAEWERRAEENVRIQAELERVKERYMARINRNLEGVTREKAAFSDWSLAKQQELQRIAEAAELCQPSDLPERKHEVHTTSALAAVGKSS